MDSWVDSSTLRAGLPSSKIETLPLTSKVTTNRALLVGLCIDGINANPSGAKSPDVPSSGFPLKSLVVM